MKITHILSALILVFVMSCSGNNSGDHGHEHGPDSHEHSEEPAHDYGNGEEHSHEPVQQEEFSVETDSSVVEDSVHTHDDGSVHHNH